MTGLPLFLFLYIYTHIYIYIYIANVYTCRNDDQWPTPSFQPSTPLRITPNGDSEGQGSHPIQLAENKISQSRPPLGHNIKRKRNSRKRHIQTQSGIFVPYFDILSNDTIYTVRIIMPLMTETAVQQMDMSMELGHRKLTISGNYIPSTLIGQDPAKRIKLRQPLLPIIYSAPKTSGKFDLEISLPDDVHDMKEKIQVLHTAWGILVVLPRRKIVQESDIDLVSCFGQTSFKPAISTSTTDLKQVPTVSSPTQDKDQDRDAPEDLDSEEEASALEPDFLIGRAVTMPGIKWGKRYAGHDYEGIIRSFQESQKFPGYMIFNATFDNCPETFDIDDLLEMNNIDQALYDRLEAACMPEKK
jgi:hypothetical protein